MRRSFKGLTLFTNFFTVENAVSSWPNVTACTVAAHMLEIKLSRDAYAYY